MAVTHRRQEAEAILRECAGRNGIWAGPTVPHKDTVGYRGQCWTRDLGISIEDLLGAGMEVDVWNHLVSLRRLQKRDGGVPTFFPDSTLEWLLQKGSLLAEDAISLDFSRVRNYAGKLARAVTRGKFFHGYTPAATDTPLHFIRALDIYKKSSNVPLISSVGEMQRSAMHAARENLVGGFYRGGDWRDNVAFVEGAILLSNNVLYAVARRALGAETAFTNDLIQAAFWTGEFHSDTGGDTFDVYGQSLAVLEGIATPEQYGSITEKIRSMRTHHGLKANDLDISDCPRKLRKANERVNQYGTIWPFVTGQAICALERMGERDLARDLFDQWTGEGGFREWYDPLTGEGGGGERQMWSAALYLRAGKEIGAFERKK